jgi:hypothetical protein
VEQIVSAVHSHISFADYSWNKAELWIQIRSPIRMDPYQIESEDLDPDPHQRDKRDPNPDPHQFADDQPKCIEYEPI